ncbi:MAG: DNA-binding protein [Clostridia bacterium]|nr:DNA-binding protein [Clostridia bacterium]
MREKNVKIVMLLDAYGPLLTERKYELLDLYYSEDYSLSEIAELTGLSRQGVRDSIKKSEAELRFFEEKLGLAEKSGETADLVARAKELTAQCGSCPAATELKEVLEKLSAMWNAG